MPNTMPEQGRGKSRRWRRTAAAALVLLIGGTVVNVAVAWGCALWITPPDVYMDGSEKPTFQNKLRGVSMVFHHYDWRLYDGRGWPFIGLYSIYPPWHPSAEPLEPISGIAIGGSPTTFAGGDLTPSLPIRVVPMQFMLNAVFYALLLWLLFATPFAARRMLRRRRGQCEKCAYPIGVSPVCTECGAAVASSLRRSAGM